MTEITNKVRNRFTSGITNDRITCITGTERLSNIKCFDELASSASVTDIMLSLIIGTEGLPTVDDLTSTTDLTDITFSCISCKQFY